MGQSATDRELPMAFEYSIHGQLTPLQPVHLSHERRSYLMMTRSVSLALPVGCLWERLSEISLLRQALVVGSLFVSWRSWDGGALFFRGVFILTGFLGERKIITIFCWERQFAQSGGRRFQV